MDVFVRKIFGFVLITAGILLFLLEFKAIPHKPSDPRKWDEFHYKHYRQIKMGGRACLLLGLTFIVNW